MTGLGPSIITTRGCVCVKMCCILRDTVSISNPSFLLDDPTLMLWRYNGIVGLVSMTSNQLIPSYSGAQYTDREYSYRTKPGYFTLQTLKSRHDTSHPAFSKKRETTKCSLELHTPRSVLWVVHNYCVSTKKCQNGKTNTVLLLLGNRVRLLSFWFPLLRNERGLGQLLDLWFRSAPSREIPRKNT